MFCGLFNFDQNHFIRTSAAWPFFWLIFLVDFLKCWKYPSNSSETFKILFFHENPQFEEKTACFADFSFLTKIAVSEPYWRGHFFWLIFWNVENTLQILLKHSKLCSFIKTISLKLSFMKTISLKKKRQVLGTFNFDQIRCIRSLPAWPFFWLIFFWLIFWKVENSLRILRKHSKCCSCMRTNSLKKKQHVLRTFQFWPISLYPDLTGVPIFMVDFLKYWKYPSNCSETFKMWFFHENKQFEEKKGKFWGPFNFDQNRCIRTLPARPFFWLIFLLIFWNVENTLPILLKIQNCVLSSKLSVWSKKSMFWGLFNFDQNRCIRTLPARRFFWFIFWNVENTFPILLKNSKFCSFIKTISLKQKLHVLRTFQFWSKSLYPDLTGVAIFLVDFLKCWKYFSNCSETFKMLFFHENKQFEEKIACFADFSILTKIAVSGPYRRAIFLVDFFVDFLKCWKYPSNSSENSKLCSFIKTISLKQKQHVLGTFRFWPKSLYPDLTGVAIFLVDFLKCWKYPSNSSETFKMLFLHENK